MAIAPAHITDASTMPTTTPATLTDDALFGGGDGGAGNGLRGGGEGRPALSDSLLAPMEAMLLIVGLGDEAQQPAHALQPISSSCSGEVAQSHALKALQASALHTLSHGFGKGGSGGAGAGGPCGEGSWQIPHSWQTSSADTPPPASSLQ